MNPPVTGSFSFPKNAPTMSIGLDANIDQGQDIIEPANPDGTPYQGGGTVVYKAAPAELVLTFTNCVSAPAHLQQDAQD